MRHAQELFKFGRELNITSTMFKPGDPTSVKRVATWIDSNENNLSRYAVSEEMAEICLENLSGVMYNIRIEIRFLLANDAADKDSADYHDKLLPLYNLRDKIIGIIERFAYYLKELQRKKVVNNGKLIRFINEYASLTTEGTSQDAESRVYSIEMLQDFGVSLKENEAFAFLDLLRTLISRRRSAHEFDPVGKALLELAEKYRKNTEIYASCLSIVEEYFPLDVSGEKLGEFLKQYDLPSAKILEAWRKEKNAITINMQAVIELEAVKPGICLQLYEEFGIADFGRYPKDMLIRQSEQSEDRAIPYGVIIFPRADWNGSFQSKGYALTDLFEKTEDRLAYRIFECESSVDFAKTLIKCHKRYSPKISFAIIGGHGTESSIQFGDSKNANGMDELHLKDLAGSGAQRASEYFKKGSTIILSSCSTGKSGGMAQQISELIQGKVIGPNEDTSILKFQISKNRNTTLRFNVEYSDPTVKEVYIDGKRTERKKPSNPFMNAGVEL